jgi:hypothetical protein
MAAKHKTYSKAHDAMKLATNIQKITVATMRLWQEYGGQTYHG